MKYTKVVCTIGPASEQVETLREMIMSGMDVARLNFSHGTYANHKMLMKNIRRVSKEQNRPIAILQDLQGPKIRMGDLKEPVLLKAGERAVLGKGGLAVQYDLSQIVSEGQRVLIDDGLVELKVLEVKPKAIVCEVVQGGTVIAHKGINVPESNTDFSVFTSKDQKDLEFGLKNGVDLVAMSFVRTANDIREVKQFIKKHAPKGAALPWVIAKIEKTQAVKNIDEIVEVSDAIMVARGDLGIEAQEEMVPIYQKGIIKKCLEKRKPVIVATQMLDSMMRNPRPTRAEVSDVANAALDHTDAVMLSGESAYGKFPKEAVRKMATIVTVTESSYFDFLPMRKTFIADPILKEAINTAKSHRAALVLVTKSGDIVKHVSNARQELPVIAATASAETARKLALVWGVIPAVVEEKLLKPKAAGALLAELEKAGHLQAEQSVVLIQSKPANGAENPSGYDLKKLA